MSIYEILTVIASGIAILISIIALRKSNLSSTAYIELYINERITDTKEKVAELFLEKEKLPTITGSANTAYPDIVKAYEKVINSAIENNLNAYEGACTIYLDDKIDKERFKKTYRTEIKRLVENSGMKQYFDATTSRFKGILKVYKEWEDLEK